MRNIESKEIKKYTKNVSVTPSLGQEIIFSNKFNSKKRNRLRKAHHHFIPSNAQFNHLHPVFTEFIFLSTWGEEKERKDRKFFGHLLS